MWRCGDCGESGVPDRHSCDPRIERAYQHGKEVGYSQAKAEGK